MDWTAEQAAEKWGYKDPTYIKKLCQRGRVKGARLEVEGSRAIWKIPEQPKPERLTPGRKATK
jgi:hypothetical protein